MTYMKRNRSAWRPALVHNTGSVDENVAYCRLSSALWSRRSRKCANRLLAISQEVGYKCFVAVDFTGVVINFKRKNDERKIKNEKKKENRQTNSQINKKNRISILENI